MASTVDSIDLVFSEAMDPALGNLSFSTEPTITPPVIKAQTWLGNTLTLEVSGLQPAINYRLELSDFQSKDGEALDSEMYLGDAALDFSTAPGMVADAPVVLAAIPAEGQQDVPVDQPAVTFTFSSPMDEAAGLTRLVGGGSDISLDGVWSADRTQLNLDLNGLEPFEEYAVTLDGFVDGQGQALEVEPYLIDGQLNFRTAELVDVLPPFVFFASPPEGQADVSPALDEIIVYFNEEMDPSVNTAPLIIGANSLPLTGVFSDNNTKLTFEVPVELADDVAYALDLVGMRDAVGNALDLAHPYLGDGRLDFVTIKPTGESCTGPLLQSGALVNGGLYSWTIPSGGVTDTDGEFACDVDAVGPDVVVRYEKQTDTLQNGGALMHVRAVPVGTSSSIFINLEISRDACDTLGGELLKCNWNKHDWDAYIDGPPGTYYVWVAKHSPATTNTPFPQTTIEIEEVSSQSAEGEGCFAPYDAASSNYVAPAGPGAPHIWNLPESINSFDMGATWGGPGSISCDTNPTYGGRLHGVDAVVEFNKTTSTSVVNVEIENTASDLGQADLNVEVLDACDPTAATTTSKNCRTNGDLLSMTAPAMAGPIFVWVSTESTVEEFGGAQLRVTEINPEPGETWGTAVPILASGPIAKSSTEAFDPPSCFSGLSSIHWFSYAVQNTVFGVRADAAAPIGVIDASGQPLGCSVDATSIPIGARVSAGDTIFIAVETNGPIDALTIDDIAYSGVSGNQQTDINISWPSIPTLDFTMVLDGATAFMGTTEAVYEFPLGGNALATEHSAAEGLTANELGLSLLVANGDVFSLDNTAATTSPRLYKIYDSGSGMWGPTTWDLAPAYPATTPTQAMTLDGAQIITVSRVASGAQFYVFDSMVPAAAVLLGENAFVGNVSGIAADSTYFYVSSNGPSGEGLYRLDRTALAAPPQYLMAFNSNTLRSAVIIDDPAAPQNLYVREAGPSDIHVLVDPAGEAPIHIGTISTLGLNNDYAMAYDPTDNSLYFFETESHPDGQIVHLQ